MTEQDREAFLKSLKVPEFTAERQAEIAEKYREQLTKSLESSAEEEEIGQRERELEKDSENNSSSQDQNQENDYDYGYGY